jgi:hypothetical protein
MVLSFPHLMRDINVFVRKKWLVIVVIIETVRKITSMVLLLSK